MNASSLYKKNLELRAKVQKGQAKRNNRYAQTRNSKVDLAKIAYERGIPIRVVKKNEGTPISQVSPFDQSDSTLSLPSFPNVNISSIGSEYTPSLTSENEEFHDTQSQFPDDETNEDDQFEDSREYFPDDPTVDNIALTEHNKKRFHAAFNALDRTIPGDANRVKKRVGKKLQKAYDEGNTDASMFDIFDQSLTEENITDPDARDSVSAALKEGRDVFASEDQARFQRVREYLKGENLLGTRMYTFERNVAEFSIGLHPQERGIAFAKAVDRMRLPPHHKEALMKLVE